MSLVTKKPMLAPEEFPRKPAPLAHLKKVTLLAGAERVAVEVDVVTAQAFGTTEVGAEQTSERIVDRSHTMCRHRRKKWREVWWAACAADELERK